MSRSATRLAGGGGLGARVVSAMLERADGRVWTTVVGGNIPAERFYTQLGFRFTGETEPMPRDPSRIERIMVRD